VAHGGLHCAPYQGAQDLISWARANWAYVDGRALLGGLDLETLRADRVLNVVQFIIADEAVVEKEYFEARTKVRDELANVAMRTERPLVDIDEELPAQSRVSFVESNEDEVLQLTKRAAARGKDPTALSIPGFDGPVA